MGEFLRRNTPKRDTSAVRVMPDKIADMFPMLTMFLTQTEWDAETHRMTGTLLVCWADGRWRAWLNDRDGTCSAWLSDVTLAGLLKGLETGLVNDTLEWRVQDVKRGRGRQS
jgi:hypothetical protein